MLDCAISQLNANGCDRLLVDLRGNIGGSLGFARLASYLCADRRPIGHSLTPRRLRTGYKLDQLPRVAMPATRAGVALALTRFAVKDKSLMLLTQGLGAQRFPRANCFACERVDEQCGRDCCSFRSGAGCRANRWTEESRQCARRLEFPGRRRVLAASAGFWMVYIGERVSKDLALSPTWLNRTHLWRSGRVKMRNSAEQLGF